MNKQRIIQIAILFGVVLLPLIYSITYLMGFWDPYNNLGDMKVAVVNLDQCDHDCKGEELVNKLKKSDSFDFVLVEENMAETGLHDKDYYAIITVPSDFSSSFDKASTSERSAATITYRPNKKTNYIASQLISNAVMQVQMELDSEVSKNVVENLSDNLKSVPLKTQKISDGLGSIANGTALLDNGVLKLSDGTKLLSNNYTVFNNGVSELNSGINKAKEGVDQLAGNSSKIKDGVGKLDESLTELKNGSQTLNDKYAEFDTGINSLKDNVGILKSKTDSLPMLIMAVNSLNQGANSLNEGLNAYKTSSDKALDDASVVYGFVVNYFESNPDMMNDPSLVGIYKIAEGYTTTSSDGLNGLDKLKKSTDSLVNGSSNLKNGVSMLNENASSLEALGTAIDNLNSGVGMLADNSLLIKDGIDKVNNGVTGIKEGTSKLNANYMLFDEGVKKLNNSSLLLANGSQTIASSSSKINEGINTLDNSVIKLKNGADSLNGGVNLAKREVDKSIDLANTDIKNLDGLAKYTSKPVKVKENGYGKVNDYGTFFSPFFMSLSLWLGSLLILIGLYYDPDNRFEVLGRNSKNKVLRFVSYVVIGIVQAIVLGTVLKLTLGFTVTNIFLFYGSCILISLAFLAIMMFLFFNLGDVGKFIAIVMLVVQLAACGGTFPLEVEPAFFNIISPYMPMTYSVELLRESFVSIEPKLLWKAVIILFSILVVFSALVISLGIMRKKLSKKSL